MLFELEFTRSVTIQQSTGVDRYGKRTYGDPEEVPACISYLIKNIKDFRGNTFITSAWIALPCGTPIDMHTKITLPDGTSPYIGSFGDAYDEEARQDVYLEVYVGRVAPGEGSL